MKLGYNEATAKDCSSLAKDLVLCEKAGFDYIEIRLDMLKDYLKTRTTDELADFFKTSRLRPHAINALYLYSEMFSEGDDPIRRDALLADFELGCRTAQKIGSDYFIIVPPLQPDPSGGPFQGSEAESYKNCVRILTKLSEMAEKYNIKLCFELVGFERSSVRSLELAERIVRDVDRDNVGYVLDSYNIYLNGGTNSHFEKIKLLRPEKIFAVHINNADDVPAEEMGQDKRRFCDSGAVDLKAFLLALKGAGYDGMVSIETFRPEYWRKSCDWVIDEAYKTTKDCLKGAGVL